MTPWKTFVDGLPRPAKPRRQDPIRLVCFDLDGVLLEQESSWVTVHQHFDVENTASLHAFLRGEISEEEFILRDVGLWRAKHPTVKLEEIEAILADELRFVPGAIETIQRLQVAGLTCAIVSSGIDVAAHAAARALGIVHVSANQLLTDPNGRLTGHGVVHTPLRDKSVPLRRFAAQLNVPLEHVASVGNSSPDISMFRASGLGIAFRPTDEFVSEAADLTVREANLKGILDPILTKAS